MLPVVVTNAAGAEIFEARDWYEARHRGLAQRFDADLDAVISRIAENPLQFGLIHKTARRAMLRRFPYGVFFRVLPDRVQIIAFLHTSRDPRRWRQRA
jgi:plasmid stabilization system protein ParE